MPPFFMSWDEKGFLGGSEPTGDFRWRDKQSRGCVSSLKKGIPVSREFENKLFCQFRQSFRLRTLLSSPLALSSLFSLREEKAHTHGSRPALRSIGLRFRLRIRVQHTHRLDYLTAPLLSPITDLHIFLYSWSEPSPPKVTFFFIL